MLWNIDNVIDVENPHMAYLTSIGRAYIHKQKLSSKSSREDMCRLPTSFLLNIQSRVKQEVDKPQIQNCVTRYSSPYWCSVPNIRKLAFVVPEKKWQNFFVTPTPTTQDDARRQKWSLYVAYAKAGRQHNYIHV